MKLKDKYKAKLARNDLTRWLLVYDTRTIVFAVGSLLISTGYAAIYGVQSIISRSMWYGMLSCYYFMLVIMRAIVVFYHRRKHKKGDNIDEYKDSLSRANICRGCGIVICLLTVPLSITILLMITDKMTFAHAGYMIYAAAAYTTYKVIMAIRHRIKSRKSTDMTVRTVRSINFADMFVSLLALQTAMFHSFPPDFDTTAFNAITGAAVCMATIVIGVLLIVNGTRAITKIKSGSDLQQAPQSEETDPN